MSFLYFDSVLGLFILHPDFIENFQNNAYFQSRIDSIINRRKETMTLLVKVFKTFFGNDKAFQDMPIRCIICFTNFDIHESKLGYELNDGRFFVMDKSFFDNSETAKNFFKALKPNLSHRLDYFDNPLLRQFIGLLTFQSRQGTSKNNIPRKNLIETTRKLRSFDYEMTYMMENASDPQRVRLSKIN